jgi:hypothetical protein
MNTKKFKILAIADGVLIVALVVVMFALKGMYKDKAVNAVKEQEGAYKKEALTVLYDYWETMDQYGMAWKLVYATLTGNKTEKSFDAMVKSIFEDQDARNKQVSYMLSASGMSDAHQGIIKDGSKLADKFLLKDEGGVKEVACGKNCVIKFIFVKGKLAENDYKALVEYKFDENFKVEPPKAFVFE